MSNNRKPIPSRLYNASSDHPYVAGAVDIIDDSKNKSQQQINAETDNTLQLHQSEINALDSQNYETYTAEDGDTLSDILPPEGEVDTVYRVGNWDGKQEMYDPTVYSEYAWNQIDEEHGEYKLLDVKEYTLATAQDFIEPDATKKAKIPTVGAVSDVFGYYITNPEYINVFLDKNKKILEAIKKDATKFFGAGVHVSGNLFVGKDATVLGRLDIDGATYATCYSPEWLYALIDKNKKIICGIRKNGKIVAFAGIEGIASKEDLEEILQAIESLEEEIPQTIIVDKNDNTKITSLLEGVILATQKPNTKVIVNAGTYDLIQEFKDYYGNDFFDNYSASSPSGIHLTNGVHIVFSSKALVTFNYTGNNQYVNTRFSPFNGVVGSFTLENLNIRAKNCRYCVHDEHDSTTNRYESHYINCNMYMDNSQNLNWESKQCIGGGLGRDGYIEVIGCIFESEGAGSSSLVSWHNNGSSNDSKSHLIIKDNYFKNQGTFGLLWYGTTTEITIAEVCNNSLGSAIVHRGIGSVENTELISWNNEIRNN